jgi:hypothetical protein
MPTSSYRRILETLDRHGVEHIVIEEKKALGRAKDRAVIALLESVLRRRNRL